MSFGKIATTLVITLLLSGCSVSTNINKPATEVKDIPAVGSSYDIASTKTTVMGASDKQFTVTATGESLMLMNLADAEAGAYLVVVPQAGSEVVVDPVNGDLTTEGRSYGNEYWKPGVYVLGEYDRANN